ncbi:MAG: DNA repair protein RecN [Erysipelotrichaceae bacterium]|nr:DNA repair protein RecN [Erysipelotrichaceae bacterium]
MLKSLHIQNYAIINDLSIDFENGFNVFTGETGAGKSIIVGALTLLLKGKADSSIISTGKEKAVVEGVFDIDDNMKNLLNDNDIEYDDELIVKRVISQDGKNSIRVNQSLVTLGFLNDLFSSHIDIHSQKDSQYLLQKKNHMILLDKYCADEELLKNYNDAYHSYKKALEELSIMENSTFSEKELDYLRFDLNELEAAELSIDEENNLIKQEKQYKSVEKYLETLNTTLNLYKEEEGISERLHTLVRNLNTDDEEIQEIRNSIESLYYSLNDEIDKLSDIFDSYNSEDIDIEKIEERLFLYSRLKRKHATNTEGLINLKVELQDKINLFDNKDRAISQKKKEVDSLYKNAENIATELNNIRSKKALNLEKSIIENTSDLMLNNVKFKVQINKTDLNENGMDDVEFMVSLNKNEDLKPLRNVASGGEISRLMLALKTVFSSISDTRLIIFDEIDTGVSGKVALSMGKKMKAISKNTQVLSITHLAPVAACADNHYYIYKTDNDNSSETMVKKLDYKDRIKELASISSTELSESSIQAAEELYNLAQS